MTKMHLTRIYQSAPEAPIHVQFALLDPSLPTVPPPPEAPSGAAEAAPVSDDSPLQESLESHAHEASDTNAAEEEGSP
jgi:hypothetical protein